MAVLRRGEYHLSTTLLQAYSSALYKAKNCCIYGGIPVLFFFKPGPYIYMFGYVNDSYFTNVLESVQWITSTGCDRCSVILWGNRGRQRYVI